MITTWRIVASQYADTAFTGFSASFVGGRWNSRGVSVVYTSSTASLAALELLVHLAHERELRGFVLFACDFSERLVNDLEDITLPKNWRDYPPPEVLQQIGDTWIMSQTSAVLRVPSVIIDTEFNYLLSPEHRDFAKVEVRNPVPFSLDLRLLRGIHSPGSR